MTTEQDYQQRFIKVIADEEECVFIVPTAVLKEANIKLDDTCIVVANTNELIIRKAGE